MDDGSKIELFESHLRQFGSVLLSLENAEVFRRANPLARFAPDSQRPALLRVTRIEAPENRA